MIPFGYGGIDRVYGNITIDDADTILDIIDMYVDVVEVLEEGEKE